MAVLMCETRWATTKVLFGVERLQRSEEEGKEVQNLEVRK